MQLSTIQKNIFTLLIIISTSVAVHSTIDAQSLSNQEDFFSTQNRLKFGNYLYSQKDYLRAINEYKEFLKKVDNDTVQFKFADCFYRIGRYREATDNFKGLFFSSMFSDEARLKFYESIFHMNNFTDLRDDIKHEYYLPEKYNKSVVRLGLISHFFDNSILPDTNKFFTAFEDSNKASIRNFYFIKKYPKQKNPTTAALLSAAIPGLGKIYTEQVGDGITAFITTGLLTFLAVDNFNHNHNFRGWLFTGLAAFSYAGNIYGSAASAQIYNAGIKFNFDNYVKIYFGSRNYLLPKLELVD